MCNYQSLDPIVRLNRLLPEWGQAVDEIYQNYHFLNLALNQIDNRLLPEDAIQQLTNVRDSLTSTLVQLLQDLPSATHRISNHQGESIHRFSFHIKTLQEINRQTDAFFEQLLQQYPPLKSWFDSITNE
ncbi:hypothetical protein GCM10027347_47060 [Larkinella harenae]